MRRLLLGLLCLSGCGDPVEPLVCVRWESVLVPSDSGAPTVEVRTCVEAR
jgi:hypothetical protein